MSDWQAGYDGLMRPPGNDRNAFNAGIAARQHQQAMADMTARHHAAMDQIRGGNGQSGPLTYGGGPVYAGGPMTAGEKKVWLIILGVIAAIAVGWVALSAIDDNMRAARKAERQRLEVEAQRQADAAWQPVLRQALERFDVRGDIDAMARAASVSPCYRDVITQVMAGRRLGFVHCPRLMSFSAPFQASVDSDRFSVEYVVPGPTIRTRMRVMPIVAWSMNAGPAQGNEAPVKRAIEHLGAATVARYIGKGCVVIDAERFASNQPVDAEAGHRRAGSPTSYANLGRVTIACPEGRDYQVAASVAYPG